MDISQSKINSWRTCRKQYYYSYIMKLTKKHTPFPFMRGSIVHDMLEAHYKEKDPWIKYKKFVKENEKVIRLNKQEYGDLPKNIKILMEGYFDYYEDEDLHPIKVEYEFKTKLVKDIYLVGKMDLIAKAQKLKWMTEHKVHNNIPSGSVVPFNNLQSSLYIHTYNKEHDALDGVLWNYLWGKPPVVPKLLKSGGMSKQNYQITWDMYKQALKENNLNPAKYLDVKKRLAGNEDLFFQRKFVPLNKVVMESIVEDTKTTALEIQKLAGKDQTRNLGRHCDYCEFKNLCIAQLKGLDDNFILKSEFKKKTKKKEKK